MATSDIDIRDHSRQTKTASSVNAILGVWLVVSPWVYGYAAPAEGMAWNSIVAGILILIFGWQRYRSPHTFVGLSWTNVALGAWTVLSPWIFNYIANEGPMWNSVIVGFVVIVLALWSGSATVTEHRQRVA